MHTDYGELLKHLGCDTYTVEHSPLRTIYRIQTVEDRRTVLDNIHNSIEGSVRIEKTHFSSVGCVKTGDQKTIFIAKPISGATENLRIKASSLSSGGTYEYLNLFGYENVPCYTFSNWNQLSSSIMTSLNENRYVSEHITSTFQEYFHRFPENPQKINWSDGVLVSEKNELGKYLGELMVGVLAFGGYVPIVENIAKFVVPVSSCFSGIDCAIINYNGTVVPISNKFGQGAKASFFSNLLPKIVRQKRKVNKNWSLQNVLDAAERVDYDERRAKEIVYNYGVKTTLNLDIETPFNVYKSIQNREETDDVRRVVSSIREKSTSENILSLLKPEHGYSSVTGFFTRSLAADLNACSDSIDFMKGLLAAKGFFQVNLNRVKWNKGEIEYSYVKSGDVSLTLIGDKSSLTDITAKQGLVNYLLRMENEKHPSRSS